MPGAAPELVVSPIQDLVATAHSVVRLAYFILSVSLSLSAQLVHFTTLTLPRIAFNVLSWGATFTLTLNFTKVLVTVLLGGTVLSYIWKVRYLNRYTSLKEVRTMVPLH
jgi:lysophospholipid hydrolase